MLREITYSSIRAGTYEPLKVMMGGVDRHNTPMSVKLAAGGIAGKHICFNAFDITPERWIVE